MEMHTRMKNELKTEVDGKLEEVLRFQKKATEGVDTRDQVLTALKTAKSSCDLRCAIRRAEDTALPEAEVQFFRDSRLPELIRAEQEKEEAERQLREQELQHKEIKMQSEIKVRDSKLQSVTSKLNVTITENSQLKADLSNKENAVRQLYVEKSTAENNCSEIQVRYETFRKTLEQKEAENRELRKSNSSLVEENTRVQAQLQAFKQQVHDKMSTEQALTAQNEELRAESRKFADEAREATKKLQHMKKACEQENMRLTQALQKSDAERQALGEKTYGLEIKLRKAQWSSTNPTPHDFITMARKREYEENLSRKLADQVRKNGDLQTMAEEYKMRNDVLWKYVPTDKEELIQRDLQGLRQSRTHVAHAYAAATK